MRRHRLLAQENLQEGHIEPNADPGKEGIGRGGKAYLKGEEESIYRPGHPFKGAAS